MIAFLTCCCFSLVLSWLTGTRFIGHFFLHTIMLKDIQKSRLYYSLTMIQGFFVAKVKKWKYHETLSWSFFVNMYVLTVAWCINTFLKLVKRLWWKQIYLDIWSVPPVGSGGITLIYSFILVCVHVHQCDKFVWYFMYVYHTQDWTEFTASLDLKFNRTFNQNISGTGKN